MSVCTFFASDYLLPEVAPTREYPLEINIDTGTIYDGAADDNFFLHSFPEVQNYTDKKYGVWLMDYYEYEDSPVIRKRTITFEEMTIHDIKELDNADIWNSPDKHMPSRPSFYCLKIVKGMKKQ